MALSVGSSLPRFSVVSPQGAKGRDPAMLAVLSGDAIDSLTIVVVAPLVVARQPAP